jgi:hypothetical protein
LGVFTVVLLTFASPVAPLGGSALAPLAPVFVGAGSAFLTGGSVFALTEAVAELPVGEVPVVELLPVPPQPQRVAKTSRQPQARQAGIVLREGALIDPRLARASV